MLSEHYRGMLQNKSVIREMCAWGAARAAQIGKENVFDYSLGNPSVPVPQAFTDEMIHLLQTQPPVALHGYSPVLGIQSVRQAVADSLKKRFGLPYEARHIFMTTGAAGAVGCSGCQPRRPAAACRRISQGKGCTRLTSFGPVIANSSPASLRQSAASSTQSPRRRAWAETWWRSGSLSAAFHFFKVAASWAEQ